MVALGDQTQRFVVLELVQAHGTFQGTTANLVVLDGGVNESREGLDDIRVKSTRHAAACEVNAASETVAGTLAGVDGGEAEDEEDGDEEGHDDGHFEVEFGRGALCGV